MTAEPDFIPISPSRIQKLVKLLSHVAVGDFAPDNLQIEQEGEEDAFSLIESTLSLFIQELVQSRAENERHIAVLQQVTRELEEKVATVESQRMTIDELSTPIIEVWKDVLTLPVVGPIDGKRSAQMTETLLARIASTGARCVVIDVTGVATVDTATASHFIQMIRAAQLLGTYCVITGFRAQIAQTVVHLGIDLGDVTTFTSLKDGLGHCLRFLRSNQ
ncbi:STAS domain-containing protein [Sorangium sp. So ce131]|uniref:STAS domain-containing protein n=1 Tax=Sorangium sp. So ce131 TaxID=3133282 RepID=UPI003F60D18E